MIQMANFRLDCQYDNYYNHNNNHNYHLHYYNSSATHHNRLSHNDNTVPNNRLYCSDYYHWSKNHNRLSHVISWTTLYPCGSNNHLRSNDHCWMDHDWSYNDKSV